MNTGTEIQSETSMVFNTGAHLQCVKSELISKSKFLRAAPLGCNPGPQMQCGNSSLLKSGPKLQCVNTMVCKLGSLLQGVMSFELTSGTKFQGMRSDLNLWPELQDIKSIMFNPVQHLQNVN